MALDGILLHKIVPEIQRSLPARIQKIYEISSTEILFQIRSANGKEQLLISCHSVYNRILLTKRKYPTPAEPGNFVMLLRKYLEGTTIETIRQSELDRWCVMEIRRHNELGDLEKIRLYIELMGKYANVILVSSEGKVIDALKRIPPFENNKRTIHPGAVFIETPSQNKKDPFLETQIDPSRTLTAQFGGFSPFLSSEAEHRMAAGQPFSDIMKEIEASDSLYVAYRNGEPVFHCIPPTSVGECRRFSLFEGFDDIYYHKEEKERIKQITGDLYHYVKRELKHQEIKLPRLFKEYDDAKDCNRWKTYGELLYAYNVTDTKGQKEIFLQDFETGQDVRIPLDEKLDGRHNAARCYQKYNKLKKGQGYLEEQIRICENELAYFRGLLEQLDQADFVTAEEIRQELIKGGYLREKENRKRRKKGKNQKEQAPHITTITLPSGIRVSFGRNNLQNDWLTWKEAGRNDLWFHAKDYHGSHVVVHDFDPDEETIRTAANIAAYFSAGRNSSSVPVNWCPVRSLKKIPGAKPGMVQLGSYRTIYIDPDADALRHLGIDV